MTSLGSIIIVYNSSKHCRHPSTRISKVFSLNKYFDYGPVISCTKSVVIASERMELDTYIQQIVYFYVTPQTLMQVGEDLLTSFCMPTMHESSFEFSPNMSSSAKNKGYT